MSDTLAIPQEQESTAEIVQANYQFPGLSDPELLEWATESGTPRGFSIGPLLTTVKRVKVKD